MPLASNNMSKLHCVHLIGRPLRGTAFDSMLVSLLAKHAVVLTLQVDLVVAPMPLQLSLALPNLQHLALMDICSHFGGPFTNDGLFTAINELTSLNTLYMQASNGRIYLKWAYLHE